MIAKLLPRNENLVDRLIRLVIGVALLAIAFVGPKTPWGYLGIIPLATAFIGSCPLYTLLGLRTCPLKD